MRRKRIALYLVVAVITVCGIMDVRQGNWLLGAGLFAAVAVLAALSLRNIRKLEEMTKKGIDPYDERVMLVAGKAARSTMVVFTLGLAVFMVGGSVLGSPRTVNPYDFAGILLAINMMLYILFYYFYQRIN